MKTLHEKIYLELEKILSFLEENYITDGDENKPEALVITCRPVKQMSQHDSYIFTLPKPRNSLSDTPRFIHAILREIQSTMPSGANDADFLVDYQLTFQHGSKKVLSLLEQLENFANQTQKLKILLRTLVNQLSQELKDLAAKWTPEKNYYLQIVLEAPRLEGKIHRYCFNYHLNDLLSGKHGHKGQLDWLYDLALNQLALYFSALELYHNTDFNLDARYLLIENPSPMCVDSGINLSDNYEEAVDPLETQALRGGVSSEEAALRVGVTQQYTACNALFFRQARAVVDSAHNKQRITVSSFI